MTNSTKRPKEPAQSSDQFQSLLDTVERLRREKFPHVEAQLVRDLLRLHADGAVTDGELARNVELTVEQRLSKGN